MVSKNGKRETHSQRQKLSTDRFLTEEANRSSETININFSENVNWGKKQEIEAEEQKEKYWKYS